jgi:hypothetical protein
MPPILRDQSRGASGIGVLFTQSMLNWTVSSRSPHVGLGSAIRHRAPDPLSPKHSALWSAHKVAIRRAENTV